MGSQLPLHIFLVRKTTDTAQVTQKATNIADPFRRAFLRAMSIPIANITVSQLLARNMIFAETSPRKVVA